MSIGYMSSYEYLKKHYGEENARKIMKSRDEALNVSSQENIEIKENRVSQILIQNLIDTGLYESSQKTSISNSNNIDLESNEIRRILTNKRLFDQEKINPNSILYRILAFDLVELNNVDEKMISNKILRYSDKIDEYYKQKFGKNLLNNISNRDLIRFINSNDFQQYYKFGYHSLNATRHTLKIDAEFLKEFSKHIFGDQKLHQFDLSIKDVSASPNFYETVDKDQKQEVVSISILKKSRSR